MKRKKGVVLGVGVNDSTYPIRPKVNGKQLHCPFYSHWKNMLVRCYCEKYQAKQPTYIGCVVCDEWLTFSNFKLWMEQQDWEGKHLDKDILVIDNKIYSPSTCVFVDASLNAFTNQYKAARGSHPIGVNLEKQSGKFKAECHNPFTGKGENLGRYATSLDAHLAWKRRKHELACQLAELQNDKRVADSLRTRYL